MAENTVGKYANLGLFFFALFISYLNWKSGKDISFALVLGAMCLCFFFRDISRTSVLRKIFNILSFVCFIVIFWLCIR